MEAAAEIIRTDLRAILPEKPHQLAKTTEWIATDDGPKDPHARDEFRVQRLQYMTFSSEADRGIVFTRAYDDIRPSPKPMPRDVNALARSGATKKRSLNDYINKKKSVASPDATPSSTPRKDVSAPVTPVQDRLKPPATDASSGRLKTVADGRDSAKRYECTLEPNATRIANICSLPLKPPPGLPPKPPTPDDSRKRRAVDDGARDKKRARPSDVEPPRSDRARDEHTKSDRAKEDREKEDRTRNVRSQDDHARDEPPRRKAQDSTVSRDTNISKEKEKEKPIRDQASALPNGRSVLKAATSSRPSSPPRARGNSINGLPNGSESARGSVSKGDSQKSNASLPKLLSPLRLSFDDNEKAGSDTNRPEKKRRAPEDDVPPKAKTQKTAEGQKTTEPRSNSKGPSLPPLLSPTLPPVVEAELERIEKSSQKEAECRPKGKEQDRNHDRDRDRDRERDRERKRDASSMARRSADDESQPITKPPATLVVTIKIPKNLRQQYRLMMKITRSALGVAQRAEKRPSSSGEPASEALKRPRASSTASKAPPPPSTPSKKGAQAMSRVSSNNSLTHTPGDAAIAATPSVPGSGDRNSQPELREKDRERIQLLKDKETEFKNLGRSLKHKSDAILLPRRDQNATNGTQPKSQSEVKLAWAHLLESLLCFVSSFHCADVQRALMNKPRDHGSWNSLGPLANTLDIELRHSRTQRDAPMVALKTLLQLVANDQFLAAIASQGEPSPDNISKLMRCERLRIGLLAQLRKANGAIESSSLRATVTPWALEDTVADMLRVTKRWCADESVKWSPVLVLKDCGLRE